MEKKLILLVISIFLVSGCEAEYNLEIKGDDYIESTSVNAGSQEVISENFTSSNIYDFYKDKPIPLFNDDAILDESNEKMNGVAYYDKTNSNDGDNINMQLEGNFQSSTIDKSNLINFAYNRFLKATIDGNVVLSTGENFKIFEQFPNLDKVTIRIKTDNNVVKNNADEIEKNTYIWHVNRDNYSDKAIYLEFNKPEENENDDFSIVFNPIILIVVLIIVVVIGLIALFVFIKNKKNNKL